MKRLVRVPFTDEELLEIVRIAHEKAKESNVNISRRIFNEYCKANYGSLLIGIISKQLSESEGQRDGWSVALRKIGVKPTSKKYSREMLIDHLYEIYKKKGKQPTEPDIVKIGISLSTIYRYFGKTSNAIREMYIEKGVEQEYVLPLNVANIRKIDRVGETLSHLPIGLEESPVNEQGIVLLFGKIHFAIGFPSIIKVQQEFPDCLAYSNIGGQLHRAKIEFKFRSGSYYRSRRSLNEWNKEVDYLICWEHDCKSLSKKINVQIISLKDELNRKEVVEKLKEHYNGRLKPTEKVIQ